MDSRDRESILEDLESMDEEVRRLAVDRLTLLPSEEAIPVLVERLGDSSWRVRKAAIDRLAASAESAEATRRLVAALGDGENTNRRNAALEALMRCGGNAVPTLLEASHDPDVDVRKQVVDALGGVGDESAAARLREEECLVRLSALGALTRMEVPVAASDVVDSLGISLLRPAAHVLLGHSDDPGAVEWLLKGVIDGSRRCREASFEALLRWVARSDPAEVEQLTGRICEAVASAPEILPDALERLSSAGLQTRLALIQFLGLLRRTDTVIPILRRRGNLSKRIPAASPVISWVGSEVMRDKPVSSPPSWIRMPSCGSPQLERSVGEVAGRRCPPWCGGSRPRWSGTRRRPRRERSTPLAKPSLRSQGCRTPHSPASSTRPSSC
jgi:hypothetical protein